MELFNKEPVSMTLKEILAYRDTVIKRGIKIGTILSHGDSQYLVVGIIRNPCRFHYIVDVLGASDKNYNYVSFDVNEVIKECKVEGYLELTSGTIRGIQELVFESYLGVMDILERSKAIEVGSLLHIKGNRYELILDLERSIEFRVDVEEPSIEDIVNSIEKELITLKSKGFHEFQLSQKDEKEMLRVLKEDELSILKARIDKVLLKIKMLKES